METFWNFMKVLVIANTALIALFIILISLPKSRLKKIFLKVLGIISYSIAGLLILYILNPIDLIPDAIPVLGQTDDAASMVEVIINGVIGYVALKKSHEAAPKKLNEKQSVTYLKRENKKVLK